MSASLRNQAYHYIRSQLVSGRLAPGTRLSHRGVAKEMGISFIPVREAMSQLVSEGLVVHEPKLGSFVMQVSRQELAELYDLREALEGHAVFVAADRINQDDLDVMQRSNDQMIAIAEAVSQHGRAAWSGEAIDRWLLCDAEFHVVLLRAAGNGRALKIVSDLRVMTHVFGHYNESRPLNDLQRVCQEHQQLLDTLHRGDGVAARLVLVEHLRAGCKLALDAHDRRRLMEAGQQGEGLTYLDALQKKIHAIESNSPAPDRPDSKAAGNGSKRKQRKPRN